MTEMTSGPKAMTTEAINKRAKSLTVLHIPDPVAKNNLNVPRPWMPQNRGADVTAKVTEHVATRVVGQQAMGKAISNDL